TILTTTLISLLYYISNQYSLEIHNILSSNTKRSEKKLSTNMGKYSKNVLVFCIGMLLVSLWCMKLSAYGKGLERGPGKGEGYLHWENQDAHVGCNNKIPGGDCTDDITVHPMKKGGEGGEKHETQDIPVEGNRIIPGGDSKNDVTIQPMKKGGRGGEKHETHDIPVEGNNKNLGGDLKNDVTIQPMKKGD
ncbi:hypothetical protein KIW84_020894, partial [Lathyrus oleraceus]